MLDAGISAPPGRGGIVMISTVSDQALGIPLAAMRITGANFSWPLANVAIFVPFVVPEAVTITKPWWANNAAGSVANIDVGIYDEAGTRLVSSGSTAFGTGQAIQSVDTTDTLLQRGRYYLAMATDSTALNAFTGAAPAAGICQALGVVRQTSAFSLPATATYAVTTHAVIPLMGAQGYRTVGP